MVDGTSGMFAVWKRMPRRARASISAVASDPVVRAVFRVLTRGRLRILAYHGVDDLTVFERAVAHISEHYQPVDGDAVLEYLERGRSLPDHAVWFTFDDGLQSSLSAAEMLAHHGISATVFVNPFTVESAGLLWFQVLQEAESQGVIPEAEAARFSRQRLKRLPDVDRRAEISELTRRVHERGGVLAPLTGSREALERWVSLGHEVGNHTWDHPCLDRCTQEEQRQQIVRAHRWLINEGYTPRFFAYPNGDWTPESEAQLRELGYRASMLFDHRLVQPSLLVHRISRLRIDSGASIRRTDAIVSGAHPGLFRALSPRH